MSEGKGPLPGVFSLGCACLLSSRRAHCFLSVDSAIGWDRWWLGALGFGRDAELLAEVSVDLGEGVAVVLQILADNFAALADALAGIAEPGAALLDDVVGDGEVEDVAFAGDTFAVENVEFGFPEGCRDLILDDLDPGA